MVVGDAMGRPLAEALAAPGATYDTSSVVIVGSGGAILSRSGQGAAARPAPERDGDGQLRRVRDRRRRHRVRHRGPGGRSPLHDGRVHDRRSTTTLRPVAPGSGVVGRLARRGHIPLGYYKDDEKTAATFVTAADGARWVVPGDFAVVEADGTHHPARPRLGVHQHRRREGVPRGGRGGAEVASGRVRRRRGRRPRRPVRRARRRHRPAAPGRSAVARGRSRITHATSSPATSCRASSCCADDDPAHPGREARLPRWPKKLATKRAEDEEVRSAL